MVKMRWRGAATGMKRNKTFVNIVECYVSNEKSRRTPCRQNLPLNFSSLHVLERSTTTPILQQVPTVRVEVEVQYPLQDGGLSEERELRGRTTDNNNLTVLNNFNGKDILKIKL